MGASFADYFSKDHDQCGLGFGDSQVPLVLFVLVRVGNTAIRSCTRAEARSRCKMTDYGTAFAPPMGTISTR
ncbi:MAG: hypothetical protein ACLQPH_19255 [Acidimicrobiales bacterium]